MHEGKRILYSLAGSVFLISAALIVVLLLTHSNFACSRDVEFYPCAPVRTLNNAIPWAYLAEPDYMMVLLLQVSVASFVILVVLNARRSTLALVSLIALLISASDHLSWIKFATHLQNNEIFRSFHFEDGRRQLQEDEGYVREILQRLQEERERLERGIGLIEHSGGLCPGYINCGLSEQDRRQISDLEYEIESIDRDIQFYEYYDFETARSDEAERYVEQQAERVSQDLNRILIHIAVGLMLLYAGSSILMLFAIAGSMIAALAVRSQALYIPYGYPFDWLSLIIPFATFVVIMLVAAAYISSNSDIFKGAKSYLRITGLIAVIVLPAVAVFGIVNFGSPILIRSAVSQLYCDDQREENCTIREGLSIVPADRPIGIIDDTFHTIDLNLENEKRLAIERLDRVDASAVSSVGSTADNLGAVYDEIIPGDFGSMVPWPSCRRHPFSTSGISCYFKKGSWNALNRVYSNAVDRGRQEYITVIQNGEDGLVGNTHQASDLIRRDIDTIFQSLEQSTKEGVAKAFGTWSIIAMDLFILASLSLVSFCLDRTFIIFGSQKGSRSVALFGARKGAGVVTVRRDIAEPMPMKNLDLGHSLGSKFYFPRAIRFAGQQDNLRLWVSRLSPLFRITSGRLLLNEAVIAKNIPVRVKFDSNGKENYFAAIELHEGERYLLKKRYICGTTAKVRVRRAFSLRLPVIKCFGLGACVVEGPGIVILRSKRRFEFFRAGPEAGVAHPSDIVFVPASTEITLGVGGRLINYFWGRPKITFNSGTYFGEVS